MKRALIFDLDNTIYPVSSISENLFDQLFTLMTENQGEMDLESLLAAKEELTRKPYHLVADKYNFSEDLKNRGIDLLKNMAYEKPMQPFEEYFHIKYIPIKKYLVTTGFTKLQLSKVKMLGIENDFMEIHIVDPEISEQTKKDVFASIMERHNYLPEEVLVIGDDPESEIKAAIELGIDTFLFDPENKHPDVLVNVRSAYLKEVFDWI